MMSRYAAPADGCRHGAAVLALLAGLCSSRAVSAQADPVELSWDAPASCPDADAVRDRVRAIAGTVSAAVSPLRAAGTISQRADGSYQLRLVVHKEGKVGERELVARSCHDLAGAAAVNLALLIEDRTPLTAAGSSAGGTTQPSATEAPPAQQASAPAATPSIPTKPDATDEAERSADVRVLIQAPGLSLALGPMPSPSVGFSLAAGVLLDPWLISASGTLWLRHESTGTRPETSAELDRLSASVRLCRGFALGRVGLAPCLSVSVEHLRGLGSGPYVRAASAATTWLAAGAGLQARYHLTSWLSVLCSADLKLQTGRARVSIEGIGPLAELGWFAAELSLGSEWIL